MFERPTVLPETAASLLTLGGGDSQTAFVATTGQYLNVATGTAAAPDSTLNPAVKISRLVSITGSVTGVPDRISGLQVITVGDSANREQVQGVTAEATNAAVASDSASMTPDAVALFGFGRIVSTGVGRGTGAYLEGRTDVAAGTTMGVEVRSNNNSGSADSLTTSGASDSQGVWITCAGSRNGAALSIGGVNNVQWDAGIVITSAGTSGPILTVSLADYSSSVTSLRINGTHTYALAVAAGAGLVAVGFGETQMRAGTVFEVNTGTTVLDPQAAFGTTNSTTNASVFIQNGSGVLRLAVAGATNAFVTGSIAGGAVINVSSTKQLDIGGSSSVIRVTGGSASPANALGFFNTTPITKYATTGTLTGFTANASANAVFNESTFTGNTGSTAYTISDIVRALKLYGLMTA